MIDPISRQAAIEATCYNCTEKEICNGICDDTDRLRELPTIDPIKYGRWISVPHKRDRICSICNGNEPYKFADENVNIFDYCPHCGAKMDERD